MKLTQPQLGRVSELAAHRAQALSMAYWADKQPGAKDITIEVTRQGAPIRVVVTGADLYVLARTVEQRVARQLKDYGIEIDDGTPTAEESR